MLNNISVHATERYFERTDQEITRKKIVSFINNGGKIIYAKRLSSTRSFGYIPIGKEVFKTIINRKSKRIISILPFKDVFNRKIQFHNKKYDNQNYLVELYPDCFQETESYHSLTQIYNIDTVPFMNIQYNHPFFDSLFNIAWKIHLETKDTIKNCKQNVIEKATKTIVD